MQITKVTVPELESACVLPPIPGNFGEGSGVWRGFFRCRCGPGCGLRDGKLSLLQPMVEVSLTHCG